VLLHDGSHDPSDDVAVERCARSSHLQQHTFYFPLDALCLVEHSRGPLPPRGGVVLIHLLLELRKQLVILAEPAAQRGVRQTSEAAVGVRPLQSGDGSSGALTVASVGSKDVGQERRREPAGVLAALAGGLCCGCCGRSCCRGSLQRLARRERTLRAAYRALHCRLRGLRGGVLCGVSRCHALTLLARIVCSDGCEAKRALHGGVRVKRRQGKGQRKLQAFEIANYHACCSNNV
jgi:hypothetical protein